MMNMMMMMIIIIRMITMSYQGWIQLENFTEIQGFLSISVLLIPICHPVLLTLSRFTLFFSRLLKNVFVSRPGLLCRRILIIV